MNRQYQQNLAALRGGHSLSDAAGISTGQAFLDSELTRLDPTVRMPLQNSTWRRDIPLQLGGGWIDNEIARNVSFRAPKDEIPGTDSNEIRVISYNRDQDTWPVYPYESRIRIPLVDGLKMAQMNVSPQGLLDKGVRLDFETSVNRRLYQGINGNYGLINNPVVATTSLPNTGTGTSTTWASKTPAQILADFNFMAVAISNASGNAPSAFPNRFLVPFAAYTQLTQLMTIGGVGGGESIASYIKRNYFGTSLGTEPEIYPLPVWLDTAGPGNTSLIVAYRFDEDNLSMRLAVDLQAFGGPLSVTSGAYEKLYVANVGVVKVNRPQTMGYFFGA